jgi:hypothetical protein
MIARVRAKSPRPLAILFAMLQWVGLAAVAGDAIEGNTAVGGIDFDTEVIPVLTKSGCNSGACHGAAAGRGGFHLSLLGSDPAADHRAIVHAMEGRRVNLFDPARSLILRKSGGVIDHGGDVALAPDSAGEKRLIRWIGEGAKRDRGKSLQELRIDPSRHVALSVPETIPLRVLAIFDNGATEEVTRWSVFAPADPTAVDVVGENALRVTRRGQHVIIVRFLDRVETITVTVPLADSPIDLSGERRANFIDDEVLEVLEGLRIPPSPPATDEAWLRRVTLDLTGRLPTPDRIEAYLADRDPLKRVAMADSLLADEAFVDYWTLRFSKLLRMHALPNEPQSLRAYVNWLRGRLASGTGFDEVAWELLTSTGDSHRVGAANFARMVGDARSQAELVGQFFAGVRLACANCHNHPLDRWTQDDYHGLAAIFARVEREREVKLAPRGDVTNPRSGEAAVPRIPGDRDLPVSGDHRHEIARWVLDSQRLPFATATVNRLWRALFGRGLVEPADDLRATNPATHPELLRRLAKDFADHGYDVRQTLRLIVLSETYGRGDQVLLGNAADDRFYSRAYPRRLEPEVLVDAVSDVTGVAEDLGRAGFQGDDTSASDVAKGDLAREGDVRGVSGIDLAGADKMTTGGMASQGGVVRRAVQWIDPATPVPVLDRLGRCRRASGCDESEVSGGDLASQLHLINGEVINRKVIADDGRLRRAIRNGESDREIVSGFYLYGLGRRPTDDELDRWAERLASQDDDERREKLEDFVWALLNGREFRENR